MTGGMLEWGSTSVLRQVVAYFSTVPFSLVCSSPGACCASLLLSACVLPRLLAHPFVSFTSVAFCGHRFGYACLGCSSPGLS